jgi:hypothetical protein
VLPVLQCALTLGGASAGALAGDALALGAASAMAALRAGLAAVAGQAARDVRLSRLADAAPGGLSITDATGSAATNALLAASSGARRVEEAAVRPERAAATAISSGASGASGARRGSSRGAGIAGTRASRGLAAGDACVLTTLLTVRAGPASAAAASLRAATSGSAADFLAAMGPAGLLFASALANRGIALTNVSATVGAAPSPSAASPAVDGGDGGGTVAGFVAAVAVAFLAGAAAFLVRRHLQRRAELRAELAKALEPPEQAPEPSTVLVVEVAPSPRERASTDGSDSVDDSPPPSLRAPDSPPRVLTAWSGDAAPAPTAAASSHAPESPTRRTQPTPASAPTARRVDSGASNIADDEVRVIAAADDDSGFPGRGGVGGVGVALGASALVGDARCGGGGALSAAAVTALRDGAGQLATLLPGQISADVSLGGLASAAAAALDAAVPALPVAGVVLSLAAALLRQVGAMEEA